MQHSGPVIGRHDNLTVIDCPACGFAHLDPLPDPASLAEFYSSKFWTEYKVGALEQFEIERPWWDAVHDDWLTLIERHVQPDELLDVGCGYGFFLAEARKHGWGITGVEPSHDARAYSEAQLGLSILPYSFGDSRLNSLAKFDCIAALWLIEHLPNPHEFLDWCHDHLLQGGLLLAAVPNDFSAIQTQANRIVKNKNWWIDPTHPNYFTPASLGNLLGRCGFRVVERSTLFPMEELVMDDDNYVDQPDLGTKIHAAVRAGDLQHGFDRLNQYQEMAREGRGREIVIVAVKE
jgi:2-polyprenyl-3-methyl-5-hydroxy-6-metoxy-1,4-benzoquinol methylase